MARSPIYEYAISLPFRFDDFGNIASTTSQSKIWADRVRSAVGTTLAERVIRPDYGTKIPTNLFSDVSKMSALVEDEVQTAFTEWLPALEFDDVAVTVNEAEGIVTAEVSYFLPNKEQTSVSIGIARISSDSPIQEELL